MFGAEALDAARLVVGAQLHAQGTGAHEALPGDDAAVVATAAVVHGAEVWGGTHTSGSITQDQSLTRTHSIFSVAIRNDIMSVPCREECLYGYDTVYDCSYTVSW